MPRAVADGAATAVARRLAFSKRGDFVDTVPCATSALIQSRSSPGLQVIVVVVQYDREGDQAWTRSRLRLVIRPAVAEAGYSITGWEQHHLRW